MSMNLKAIEVEGLIDEQHQLQLCEPLPVTSPGRVRVIILIPDSADIEECEWLHAATVNPAFDSLNDPAEDLYTLADGQPFND